VRALVTGCAGFIGSQLSERLLADGHDVFGLDCLTDYYATSLKRANLENLRSHPRFTFIDADLVQADLTPLVAGIDLIYHQAAQPGVRGSWGNSFEIYVRNNISATQRLLEAVKDQPLRKFVYASSSSVYGDAEAYPTSEDALPRPVSPYGATKLAAEHLVSLYCRNYGVPTIALRYFTVYGPRHRPDMAFHRFIRSALENRPIEIYGDGEQTRDFTYIADALDANVAAAACGSSGLALNIGGGSRVSVNQVIAMLEELLGRKISVHYAGTARGDVRHTSADTCRAGRLLGYSPKVDLRTGLAAEIAWLKGALDQNLLGPPQ
jgi:nucleoside-diphosphate-sugar epimerase